MRTVHSERFIVPVKASINIKKVLASLGAIELMDDRLMVRTIFQHAGDNGESGWVRVRAGDVDADGESRCRLTYKIVEQMNDFKVERKIDLAVASYEECVELLTRIGMTRLSRQETRRDKFLCSYADATYTISFDKWPWLEDLRFVSIEPLEGISPDSLDDFRDRLGLADHRGYKGGVDTVYKERLGFEVSFIPDVRFNIPIPPREAYFNTNQK